MQGTPPAKPLFPVENDYIRCVDDLNSIGILIHFPKTGEIGVIGADGKEYPIPGLDQIKKLFDLNAELAGRKIPQGFDRLELVPMAITLPFLIDRTRETIIKHEEEGNIYQTRRSQSDPFLPVRVNKEKHVWIWETLLQAIERDELVYFPEEYSVNHRGLMKSEVINDKRYCAFPGWSVELVESLPVMFQPGKGKTSGGRKQLESGFSPNEYMQLLKKEAYFGETGKTLEDFLVRFLTQLETTNEVSNDVDDHNAIWCLAHYLKISYADLVPTGRWHRTIGRIRLDMHRSNNKKCTKSWGATTTVRLQGT